MVDPTGLVDLSNAGLYAARGQWDDAALTAAGIVPYAGDVAKIAKVRKVWKGKEVVGGKYGNKGTIREQAREIWEKVAGYRADNLGLEVHHRIPLEWAYLFPEMQVNNPSNLVGVPKQLHRQVITPKWNAFQRLYPNPTPAQVLWFVRALDRRYGHQFTPLTHYLFRRL